MYTHLAQRDYPFPLSLTCGALCSLLQIDESASLLRTQVFAANSAKWTRGALGAGWWGRPDFVVSVK